MRRHQLNTLPGMSLIEVIVALAVAAIISVILYQTFYQSVRFANRADALVDDYADILVLANQLERDFAGIFIPLPDLAISTTQLRKETNTTAASAPQQSSDAKIPAPQGSGEASKLQAFVCESKDKKLTSLAIYTTSALPTVDHPAARLVRVTYTLAAHQRDSDEQAHNMSTLLRHEEPYQPATTNPASRPHALMSTVEAISCTCYYHAVEEAPANKPAEKAEKKADAKKSARGVTTWNNASAENPNAAQGAKKLPPVPEYVEFSGTYISRITHEKIPFSFIVPIPIAAVPLCREQQT
jgi:prepilin-type N-terminal cleavage/methylation domain-containing protein